MAVSITISPVELARLSDELDLLERIVNAPARYFQDDIVAELIDDEESIFASSGGGRWPPRKDNLPHPLLIKTGRLMDSLTNISDPDNILEVSDERIRFGTYVEYGIYHEEGTDRIPQRSFLEILEDFGLEDRLVGIIETELSRLG